MSSTSSGGNRRERSWGLAFVLAITLFIAAALSLNANPALADQTDVEAPATQPATAAATTDAATTTDAPAASAAAETPENNVAALTADLNNGIATQAVNGDADPLEVFFLVLIDRDWVYVDANGNIYDSPNDEGYVKSYTTHQDTNWGGKGAGRWFVTGDQLEQVYGPKFGFKVTDLIYSKRSGEGQAMFPHVEEDGAGASKPRGTIWADTRPWYSGSLGATSELDEAAKWRIPGVTITSQNRGKRIYYYYLPNNTEDSTRNPQKYPDYFTSSASPNDSARVNGNSFFSVGVDDREGLVYTDGEQVPSVAYALARRSFSYTVKAAGADVTWNVYMDGVLLDPSSGRFSANYNSDGTVTYTFPYDYASEQGNGTNLGVTGRVVFAPTKSQAGIHSIAYIAAMSDDQKQDVGDYTSSLQRLDESTNATVGGKSQTIETFDEAEGDVYTVLAPDTDQVATTDEYAWNSNGRKFLYEFKGWKVSGTNTILQAGQQLTADDLKLLAPSGLLSLKAQWSILLDNGYSTTCNFFVNTSCEVEDNLQNGYTSHTGSDYTTSVYATSVYGAEGIAKQVEDGKVKTKTIQVTETDTQMNCYELDQMLRNSATTPVPVEYDYSGVGSAHPDKRPTRVDYSGPGISLKQMPSDEQALAGVRAWVNADSSHKVTIDGESIAASDITSANFTVRWYVLKNEKSDGWHVDGILVAKKAQMVVAKTFEGDSEAIDKLTGYGASTFDASNPDDFYVQVSHTETVNGASQDVTDYQLLTVPDSEVKRTGTSDRRYGYSSYDASTNTYYWEVNTRQGREYSVREMNSVYTGSDPTVSWNNSRWVNVRNSGSSDTNGWVEYDRNNSVDVRLRAASLPADLPLSSRQTVSFRNMYVHSGTLVVRKADYTTGDPMAGVKFQIMSAVNSEFESLSLYRKTGTHEYTTVTAAAADPAYEKVDDAKAETDENGTFYLALGVRTSETTKTGTYRLVEDYDTAPGYTGARSITVTVTDDKGIDGNIVVDGDDSGITWAHKGMSDFTLEIVNRSQELTTLAAKKRWETTLSDGEEGDDTEKPVKVQLWRRYGPEGSQRVEEVPDGTFTQNGVEVPRLVDENGKAASNTVELSVANNWCFRWGALPLFIDNCEVTYFLRETWIGDTSYDAGADADSGYAAYKVTYDEARFTNTATAPDVTSATGYKAGFDHTTSHWTDDAGKTVFSKHELLAVNNSEKRGQITFTKKDREGSAGMPLGGAVFQLFYDEDCTRPVTGGTAASTEGGLVSFTKVPVGTYYFKETQAPAGYTYAENAVYKAVVTSGDPVITLVGDDAQTRLTTITNKFGAALKIHKVGGGDQPLAGAAFSVSKAGGTGEWAQPQTGVTDEDGNLWLTGVSQGSYTVTETKAANGYETPESNTFTFTVDTQGTTISAKPGELGDVFVAWNQVSDDTCETGGNGIVFQLSVKNTALFSLPTTGGMGIGVTTTAGVALMCGAMYAWMRRRADAAGGSRPKGGHHA